MSFVVSVNYKHQKFRTDQCNLHVDGRPAPGHEVGLERMDGLPSVRGKSRKDRLLAVDLEGIGESLAWPATRKDINQPRKQQPCRRPPSDLSRRCGVQRQLTGHGCHICRRSSVPAASRKAILAPSALSADGVCSREPPTVSMATRTHRLAPCGVGRSVSTVYN
jgi:hypothetical protein